MQKALSEAQSRDESIAASEAESREQGHKKKQRKLRLHRKKPSRKPVKNRKDRHRAQGWQNGLQAMKQ